MALYLDILNAVKERLEAIESLEGIRITVRKRPSFVPAQDELPQVVIAPREDLAEIVGDLQYGNSVNLIFEVYVGVVVDARWTDDRTLDRLTWREDIRKDLWNPLRLGLTASGEWDVNYDSQPAGAEPAPPNTDGSWQRFDYTLTTARYA